MTDQQMAEYENPTYPIFHWDIVQGTEEWHDIRKGKITGSVAKTFLVKGQGINGFGAGAITELYQMLEERLTGQARESWGSSKATNFGHGYESEAIEYYEMINFRKGKAVGFVERSAYTGTSPDYLFPELQKGLEVKCFPKEHLKIVDSGKYGTDEYIQCQFNLWCTGYDTWDLIYYSPKIPEPSKAAIHTFIPDRELFAKFNDAEKRFIKTLEEKLKKHKS